MIKIQGLPCSHIPYSHLAVASSANQDIVPGNHRPYPHYVPLERFLIITVGVVYMNLGIIQGDDDVFRGEMQTRDHPLVGGDMPLSASATFIPSRLNHIFLLEV